MLPISSYGMAREVGASDVSAHERVLLRTFDTHKNAQGLADFGLSRSEMLSLFSVGNEVEIYLSPEEGIYAMDIGFTDLQNAQAWTMPDIPYGDPSNWRILDPQTTPYAASFPAATHTLFSENDQVQDGKVYLYYQFTETQLIMLGEKVEPPGGGPVETITYNFPLAAFPLDETFDLSIERQVVLNSDGHNGTTVNEEQVAEMHGFGSFTLSENETIQSGAFIDDIVWRDPDDPNTIVDFETYYSIFGTDGTWFSFYIADPPSDSGVEGVPIDGDVFIEDVEFWRITQTSLPVELTAFEVAVERQAAQLTWRTASETNNAGFEVQHRLGSTDWKTLAFVDGAGTVLSPQHYAFQTERLAVGEHQFRLKQVDFDGQVHYSPVVEAAIALPTAYEVSLAYPNPFQATTAFHVTLASTQHVRVVVVDVLGRPVAHLHNDLLRGQVNHAFVFDGTGLPSGTYLIQVTGETFHQNRMVTLLK